MGVRPQKKRAALASSEWCISSSIPSGASRLAGGDPDADIERNTAENGLPAPKSSQISFFWAKLSKFRPFFDPYAVGCRRETLTSLGPLAAVKTACVCTEPESASAEPRLSESSPSPARRKVKGVSLVLRGTRTPPTLSGSLRGGPNGHAPGRAVGLLQRTLQSHLTHTRARVGESHLQHPLLAITGWALPAARGALTAGNGLESNTPPDDATHVWVSSGGTSVECCYCRPEGLLYSTALHTRSWRDGRNRTRDGCDCRLVP